jgi:tetratricopeptide (TPR) repeat protein
MIRFATLAGVAAVAVAGIGVMGAGSARAAVTVYGSGFAEQCFHAARDGGDLYGGIADCNQALIEDQLQGRDLAGTYVNRGVLRMAVNQYGAAESDFEKSIGIDPNLGEAWVNLGALKIANHQFVDGIADIDKGLALGPQEPEKAYYNRALADEAMDNETAAYYDYTKASQLKPNWAPPKTELTRFTVRPAS